MDGFKIQDNDTKLADIKKIERLFYKALETDKESKDILVELIRHKVPIHCGGMSDPFQSREWEYGLTKHLIELSNKYEYPIQFSTKTAYLPKEYIDLLNPEIHAFQVSLIGWDEEYIRRWEHNTPTAQERIQLIKTLRENGIWCGLRIQPVIDIVQVENLLYNINDGIDYITVEHFKLIYDTENAKNAFIKNIPNPTDYEVHNHKVQLKRNLKIANIKRIQEIANSFGVDVGVGDNELHYMTQGRTCCGIDRIPAFSNYLKYNLCYMCTGEMEDDVFIPQCNPRKHINDQKFGNVIDCKEYTDEYIKRHLDYLGDNRSSIEKKLIGTTQKTLF